MGDKTGIAWTGTVQPDGTVTPGATWNPIRGTAGNWTCVRWSAGCEHCYAETLNKRFGGPGFVTGADVPRLDERILEQPLRWQRPRKIFVCSMTDLFEQRVLDEWLPRIFAVMALAKQHTFQVLTKRPERMRAVLADDDFADTVESFVRDLALSHGWPCADELEEWPLPNVWCGVSIEQDRWTGRADLLLKTPAAVRFISAEPLLEPLPSLLLGGIDWLIFGGESGPGGRWMVERCDHEVYYTFPNGTRHHVTEDREHCILCCGTGWRPLDWARDEARRLRDLTHAAGGAFFLKQFGGPTPKSAGNVLDGRTWEEFPAVAE